MKKKGDLEQYIEAALEFGATGATIIRPETVVTAPWVRWKCQFGCGGFGLSHCCPPNTPSDAETRRMLDSYQRAILFHQETPHEGGGRKKVLREYFANLVTLEGRVFKDGYYRALVLLAGPCRLCGECAKTKGSSCNFSAKARPSMEACGIDVFQTARNHGFPIQTLREKAETQNGYSLLLID